MANLKQIILIDENDNQTGIGEKIDVHKKVLLHRAFSVFIFNKKGELLLQQRAKTKYHSPGLWANACCSHPRPNKNIQKEAEKRLYEEMGIKCKLKEIFTFIYKAKLGELTEHELDHVFIGGYNGSPKPNKDEVDDWQWLSPQKLKKDTKKHPEKYATWLKKVLEKVLAYHLR